MRCTYFKAREEGREEKSSEGKQPTEIVPALNSPMNIQYAIASKSLRLLTKLAVVAH